jgi:hypothetical protein
MCSAMPDPFHEPGGRTVVEMQEAASSVSNAAVRLYDRVHIEVVQQRHSRLAGRLWRDLGLSGNDASSDAVSRTILPSHLLPDPLCSLSAERTTCGAAFETCHHVAYLGLPDMILSFWAPPPGAPGRARFHFPWASRQVALGVP